MGTMTLFDKAKLIVKGELHELLNKKVNTPAGFDEAIRDLDGALAEIRLGVDEAVGTANGYRREIISMQATIVKNEASADDMFVDDDPNNDDSALQLQMEADRLKEQVEEYQQMLADQEQTVAQLNLAVTQLEAKYQQMLTDSRRLRQTATITKNKTRASDAVDRASQVAGDTPSVDSIKAELDHQRDVADARFNRVVGGMQASQSPEEAARIARAKAALAARRAALTEQAKAEVEQSAESSIS